MSLTSARVGATQTTDSDGRRNDTCLWYNPAIAASVLPEAVGAHSSASLPRTNSDMIADCIGQGRRRLKNTGMASGINWLMSELIFPRKRASGRLHGSPSCYLH